MVLAWIITIPATALIAFAMFHLTQLPTVLAWITVGAVLVAFSAWAVWTMRHTIHAKDVEAELPPESALASGVGGAPHLVDRGPAA